MLISKDEFVGIEEGAHLCTGGESPPLKIHQEATAQFFADKAIGEESRVKLIDTYYRCKELAGKLIHAPAEDITFLSSSTHGINLLAQALDWEEGDNVVVADVEFPSDVWPWARLAPAGVELRVIRHEKWYTQLEAIADAIDDRTRVVAISQVSYFTGQHHNIAALSEIVRASNALLLVDATHAAGSVSVYAPYADVLVSSCYKWLLAVHGTALLYVNSERLPDLQPPAVGWNSTASDRSWHDPSSYELKTGADRFLAGNPSFLSLYVLEASLKRILDVGVDKIAAHNIALSGRVHAGLVARGYEVMTPASPAERAGNVSFVADDMPGLVRALEGHGVYLWGRDGDVHRIRVSTHLYNDDSDVDRLFAALDAL